MSQYTWGEGTPLTEAALIEMARLMSIRVLTPLKDLRELEIANEAIKRWRLRVYAPRV